MAVILTEVDWQIGILGGSDIGRGRLAVMVGRLVVLVGSGGDYRKIGIIGGSVSGRGRLADWQ